MRFLRALGFSVLLAMVTQPASATITDIPFCNGAISCVLTSTPPNPVVPDPNDGTLLVWNEVQNLTLTSALRVDRVFDSLAPFINDLGNGEFEIVAGTVISSHYIQWDPGNDSSNRVVAYLDADAQTYAVIASDQNFSASDALLGLTGVDYGTFSNRSLEANDITNFNTATLVLSWEASSPGEWARLITGYSAVADVPVPPGAAMVASLLPMAMLIKRRRR